MTIAAGSATAVVIAAGCNYTFAARPHDERESVIAGR